jgi:hypothetical protein
MNWMIIQLLKFVKHCQNAWWFFKSRALNRNFQDGAICIVDNQDRVHIITTRRELWDIAWETTKEQ